MKKINILLFFFSLLFALTSRVSALPDLLQIDDKKYKTFEEAIEDIKDNSLVTIKVINDTLQTPGFKILSTSPKNIIIDFDNHTVVLDSAYSIESNILLQENSNITLKNGSLIADKNAKILIQNYSNLTLENMTLDCTLSKSCKYALSNNSGEINIIGKTNIYSPKVALDAYWWPSEGYKSGANVNISTLGTIKGDIEMSSDGSKDSKTLITINNINHEGKFNIEESLKPNLNINGGVYSSNIEEYINDKALKLYKILDKDFYVCSKEELSKELIIKNKVEKEIPKSDLELIKNSINSKYKIFSYYDISLGNFIKENLISYEDSSNQDILVTLDTSGIEELKNGYTRKYSIIRLHNNVSDILDVNLNEDDTISFKTNKFSTFALVYQDTLIKNVSKNITNPNTLDNITAHIIILLLSLTLFITIIRKRKNNFIK